MANKVYYVIEKQLQEAGIGEETNGWKSVRGYRIDTTKEELKEMFELEILLEDNSIEAMRDWFDENGYNHKDFQFINL